MKINFSRRTKLFGLIMSVIILVSALVVRVGKPPVYKKGSSATYDTAVAGAVSLYRKRLIEGVDMSKGPCLSNDLMNGWVVDVVHNPRESVDTLPENQCAAYLEGRAEHFVEMDISGNLVRVR